MTTRTTNQRKYVVRAERVDAENLRGKLIDIAVLAADLSSSPRASEAEALMYLAADVLFTLECSARSRASA